MAKQVHISGYWINNNRGDDSEVKKDLDLDLGSILHKRIYWRPKLLATCKMKPAVDYVAKHNNDSMDNKFTTNCQILKCFWDQKWFSKLDNGDLYPGQFTL